MKGNIFKTTTVYTILGFLPLASAFFFTPIYLKYLSKAEYGLFSLFNLVTGILAHLYSFGIGPACSFLYWDYYKDKKKLNQLLASSIGLILIIQSTLLILGLVFGKQILTVIVKSKQEFSFYPFFFMSLILPIFTVFYELFLYYYRNEGNLKNYSILSVSVLIFVTIGSIIGIIFLDLKAEGAIIGKTLGYAIVIVTFLIYIISKVGVKLDLTVSGNLLKHGFPLFLSVIIGAFGYSMDRILIERIWGLEDLGLYSFAFVTVSLIEVLFNALNNSLSPIMYKYMVENIEMYANSIRSIAHSILFTVLSAIVLLIAFMKPMLDFIIPETYHGATLFIPILSISLIGRVFTSLISYIFYKEKKTKLLPILQVINLILILGLGFIFGQFFGVIGIVYAVLVSKLIELLIVKYLTDKIYYFNFNFKNFYILSIICLLSVLFSTYLSNRINIYVSFTIPLIVYLSMVLLDASTKNKYQDLATQLED